MVKYRVPIRVNVAPVQTYEKVIEVEASDPKEAADLIRAFKRPGNSILSDAIHSSGWRALGGRLGPIVPEHTIYDTYLDERGLDEWVVAHLLENGSQS